LFVQVTTRAFRFLRQLRPLTDIPNVRRGSNQTVLIHTCASEKVIPPFRDMR